MTKVGREIVREELFRGNALHSVEAVVCDWGDPV